MGALKTIPAFARAALIAILLALGLAFLGAEPAQAALTTSNPQATELSTQAGATKTMYVVASTKSAYSATGITAKVAYGYNKNKLLIKRSTPSKTLETFTYKGKRLTNSWKDGGQGAPSVLKYYYKKGKLYKSYDTFNYNKKLFALNKSGKVKRQTTVYSSSNVHTYYKYNKNGKPVSCKYSTWNVNSDEMTYDSKGNLKSHREYSNNSKYNYTTTKYTNVYKKGRLVKTVAKAQNGSKTTTYITYKKVKVPAAYASLVKRQQADILLRYVGDPYMAFYGVPLGYI